MKKTLLPILLLLVTFGALAQSKPVFEETLSETLLVKQNQAAGGRQANSNTILKLLSAGPLANDKGGRPNRKAEFTVRFDQQARITKAGNNLQLRVQLSKVSVTGNVLYRGFNLDEVLLPEKLNAKIMLLNAQHKVVSTYTPGSISFNKNGAQLLEVTVPDTAANQRYTLKVESKELLYTSENVRQLQARLDLINGYYAAEATVNKALQDLARIQPDDVDRISQHDQNLRKLEEAYSRLQAAAYPEKLNLQQHDPLRLTTRLNQLHKELQERRRALNFALSTLDQQLYNRGISYLAAGNGSVAQVYFQKSLEANPLFAPSHLQLARLDFEGGHVREAAARTRDLLTQMRVDPQTAQQALGLAHDIYAVYITDGNNLTHRGDYSNALAAYGEARALCSTIGGLRCNLPALNDGEGRAAYGAFTGMVENGKRLLARNDLAGADRAANEAQAFQREYDVVLRDAPEADDLQRQVKYQFYLAHIDQGKRALADRNYNAAISQFEAAQDLEATYTFSPVRELVQLAQRAAKPVLLAQLKQGYEQAMSNRLADARAAASAAVGMQAKYKLEGDMEVQASYAQLRNQIFTQECANTQSAYDDHYNKGRELERQKKFIFADMAYQAAIKAAGEQAACGISTFSATDSRATIAQAVAYQQLLENVNRLVSSKRYTDAIQQYNEAERHYLAHEIRRFGLDLISLFNFAKDHRTMPFTAAVVQHFINIKEENVSLMLLHTLLEKGYSKGKTNKVQEQLARQLALKDATRGIPETPKELAAGYKNGNKKLNKFGRVYEREYKKLKKA